MGALSVLTKPVTGDKLELAFDDIVGFIERRQKRLLVVEDEELQRNKIVELIGNGDVLTTAVGSGREALAALKEHRFDCMVLDLTLPDISGFELLAEIGKEERLRDLPIIIYTAKDLAKKEETELKRVTQTIVLKDVRSPERARGNFPVSP